MDSDVCAVAFPTPALEAAIDGQWHAPGEVVWDNDPLGRGLTRGLRSGARWLWLLDGGAVPRPNALVTLTEAMERAGGPALPALLAGVVLRAGQVDAAQAPWYLRAPTETAMEAAPRRLLPIRAAAGPVLVRVDAAAASRPRQGAAGGSLALLGWSGGVLRAPGHPGYWVPASEYDAIARNPAPSLSGLAAVFLGAAFSPSERIRLGLELRARRGRGRRGQPSPRCEGAPGVGRPPARAQ